MGRARVYFPAVLGDQKTLDPVLHLLDDPRYFTLLYEGENVWEARTVRIYRIVYNGV